MTRTPSPLAQLKRNLDPPDRHPARFALGEADSDARLGGGLAYGALHEICAAVSGDQCAASGFALMLALRAAGDKPLLWVREDKGERLSGRLYGPGMAELGAAPERIILVRAPDTLAALRAGVDGIGAAGPGAVVIEPFGAAKALDLTASRKLVLAAERSGVVALILRAAESRFASAAATRWQVAAAPSQPLPGQAPGQTRLVLSLVRHRGGVAPFDIVLEWNRDQLVFAKPSLSGAILPAAERRQMAA